MKIYRAVYYNKQSQIAQQEFIKADARLEALRHAHLKAKRDRASLVGDDIVQVKRIIKSWDTIVTDITESG